MARIALAVASLALLSLGAVAPALASPSATVVIQTGTPSSYYQHPVQRPALAPLQVTPVQYHAPPPPRYEAPPHARRGMAWVPGHWEWRGGRHVWIQGYWVKARPGYTYREPRWEERDGRHHMRPGGWDRDGDGVPNRHDRRPDNPYRN